MTTSAKPPARVHVLFNPGNQMHAAVTSRRRAESIKYNNDTIHEYRLVKPAARKAKKRGRR